MTRRRARTRARRNWTAAAAAVVLVLLLAHGFPPAWLLIAIGVIAAGVAIWRAERPARRIPRGRRPQRVYTDWDAPARPVTRPRPRAGATDARARRNGWAPPASTNLRPVSISAECATDEHIFCPGAGCGCPCRHDPHVIAAMNEARYTANPTDPTTTPARPATDTGPIPF